MEAGQIDWAVYEAQKDLWSPEVRREVERRLAEYGALIRANPLQAFRPHPAGEGGRRPQLEFIEARTPVVAAFAGTRFGKSTVLGVCALRECLDREVLPELLSTTKRFEAPAAGWILVPTEDKIDDSFRPVFQKWCPASAFQGGSWGKAFNGATNTLRFKNGSTIAFKTYKQDPSTLGGAALHFVGYDEPPPRKHREECMFRLIDYGGFEMFAMTPLDTNTGYVRREIYKRRESPDITVVQGSIHDNPTLDAATRQRALGTVSDIYRAAREFGIFVDVGGLIYPDFERCVVKEPWSADFVRGLDVVVGIDPGMRNCGLVWVGFDGEQVAYVFHDELLQDKTAKDYATRIRAVNSLYGLQGVSYVVDPAAKQRAQANGMTVLSELNNEGVYPNLGQNDHELGFGQMRIRMQHGRFKVSPACVGLRDEADDYAAKEPEEGKDDSRLEPIKGNDHRLDACFVSGTLIATEIGQRPIESIRVGDRVWTRSGLRRVSCAAKTGESREVWSLPTADGPPLIGTANHPVWTGRAGWTALDAVRYDDILCEWAKWSSSTESSTGVTRIPGGALIASTSERPRAVAISTGRSGSTTTVLFPTAGTSTIATGIHSTTTLPTSLASRPFNTAPSTGLRNLPSSAASTLLASGRFQRRGILRRRVERGILRLAGRLGRAVSRLNESALSVVPSSTQSAFARMIGSARTLASRGGVEHPDWTTSSANAASATDGSRSTSTPSSGSVRDGVAARRVGVAPVFNLTVEGEPEYFANGVLVHNCRYAVLERFWDPVLEDQAPERRLGLQFTDHGLEASGDPWQVAREAPPLGSMM